MDKKGYTYILASEKNGTIYIGVTSNLQTRILQHKHKTFDSFTAKYDINVLVWFEELSTIQEAILYEKKIKGRTRKKKIKGRTRKKKIKGRTRKKKIKGRTRKKKIALIESNNPNWEDLS